MVSLAFGVLESMGFYYILSALLIFAIVFGILSKIQVFGDQAWLNALVAVVVALLFISIIEMISFVRVFVPVLIGFILILLFILLIFQFMGVDSSAIAGAFKNRTSLTIMLFVVILILVISSMQAAAPGLFEQPSGEFGTGEAEKTSAQQMQETVRLIFSPAVFGVIIILILFGTLIWFITK